VIIITKEGRKYKGIGIKLPTYYKLFQHLIWNYEKIRWDDSRVDTKLIHKIEIKKVLRE
jgi:hypothetical protein